MRLAPDGEIQAKGANVFKGYFKEPAATAEAFVDGWFCTGDIGTVDAQGFWRITDRKKNILITSGGKNITPSNIEAEVKATPLISYCHIHADKRPFPVALVCLEPGQLETLAREHNLPGRTAAELKDHAVVQAAVREAIERANNRLAQYERVKKFAVLPREFSIDGGELTPSLKVKRKEVDQRYAAILDGLYAQP